MLAQYVFVLGKFVKRKYEIIHELQKEYQL